MRSLLRTFVWLRRKFWGSRKMGQQKRDGGFKQLILSCLRLLCVWNSVAKRMLEFLMLQKWIWAHNKQTSLQGSTNIAFFFFFLNMGLKHMQVLLVFYCFDIVKKLTLVFWVPEGLPSRWSEISATENSYLVQSCRGGRGILPSQHIYVTNG